MSLFHPDRNKILRFEIFQFDLPDKLMVDPTKTNGGSNQNDCIVDEREIISLQNQSDDTKLFDFRMNLFDDSSS